MEEKIIEKFNECLVQLGYDLQDYDEETAIDMMASNFKKRLHKLFQEERKNGRN